MPKLTDLFIDKLPFSKERKELYDSLLPGFAIRVGMRTKTFIVVNSKGIRLKLGHYPAMKLSEAREKARECMRGTSARPGAFSDVLDAYTERHLKKNCRESHAVEIERLLRRHFPFGKSIGFITKAEIATAIDQIDSNSVANHATVAIKMLFNWAESRGYIDHNPIAKLKKPYAEKSRERVLTYDELAKIWQASNSFQNIGNLIKLAILTGQRKGELYLNQHWYIKNGMATLPSAITKNKRDHHLPLTPRCLEIFNQLTPGRALTWSQHKKRLDELSGVTDWVIHDLRRTFATNLGDLQVQPFIIEKILNHSNPAHLGGTIGNIYNKARYLQEMADALRQYDDELVRRKVIA